MTTSSIRGVSLDTVDSAKPSKREEGKIADAARQFEALLISQILKSACDASTMTGSTGADDPGGATAIEMAQEQFAAALSARGGMGIATMVTSTFRKQIDSPRM